MGRRTRTIVVPSKIGGLLSDKNRKLESMPIWLRAMAAPYKLVGPTVVVAPFDVELVQIGNGWVVDDEPSYDDPVLKSAIFPSPAFYHLTNGAIDRTVYTVNESEYAHVGGCFLSLFAENVADLEAFKNDFGIEDEIVLNTTVMQTL